MAFLKFVGIPVLDTIMVAINPTIFDQQINLESFLFIRWIGLFFCYYALMEYFFRVTIGKLITFSKVATEEGYKPTFGAILLRTACRIIPLLDAASFLGKTGIHDSISGTMVVPIKAVYADRPVEKKLISFAAPSIKLPPVSSLKLNVIMYFAFSLIALNILAYLNKSYHYKNNNITRDQFEQLISKAPTYQRVDVIMYARPFYFGVIPGWFPNVFYIGYLLIVVMLVVWYNKDYTTEEDEVNILKIKRVLNDMKIRKFNARKISQEK